MVFKILNAYNTGFCFCFAFDFSNENIFHLDNCLHFNFRISSSYIAKAHFCTLYMKIYREDSHAHFKWFTTHKLFKFNDNFEDISNKLIYFIKILI